MNAFDSSPGCSRGRRWPLCAGPSGSPARPATRSFSATRTWGSKGLTDRSRSDPIGKPIGCPSRSSSSSCRSRKEQPSWGAPKIREKLRRLYPDIHAPATSTVHAVLDRHGLVKRRKKRRAKLQGTKLSRPRKPNDVWCADYKGEFMLADHRYCYPLTVTDFESRYLLACEALSSTKEKYAFSVFERVFKEFGMPKTIRTDNGIPFACANALYGLSRLSVWWLRLGIADRAHPSGPSARQRPATSACTARSRPRRQSPPATTSCSSRDASTTSSSTSTTSDPHQALDMKSPAQHYTRSTRPYRGLPSVDYPFHDKTVTVTACGRICLKTKKVNLSNVFAGQKVGIKQVDDRLWLTSFMTYDLGYFDEDSCRLEPIEDPFGSKVLPMSSE